MPSTRSLAWSELKIGITAVAAVGLAVLLIAAVGGQSGFFWQNYQLFTIFDDVAGLKEGAVVRLAGVEVGRVAHIAFAGADVRVAMDVRDDMQSLITTESRASLGSLSLLGEPLVDITASRNGVPLDDGAFIPSMRSGGELSDVAEGAALSLDQLTALLADIRAGKGTVGRLFTDEQLYREIKTLVDALEDVAPRASEGEGSLGQLIRDPSAYRNLTAALDNLRQITATIAEGEGSFGRLVNDASFANAITGAATNLDELTSRVVAGKGTAGKLVTDPELYNRLNKLGGRLDHLAMLLQRGEGTIGRLLQDPELYANVNTAVREFRGLISDIQKDPRKYLNVQVSIF